MFIVRNNVNPALILTAANAWKPSRMVGPGGYAARIFKTKAGAAKHGTPEAL